MSSDSDSSSVENNGPNLIDEESSSINHNSQPIIPDISSNDEDDGQESKIDDSDGENNNDAESIVGPRLYSDPEEEEEKEEDVQPTLIELDMAICRPDLGTGGPLFVKFPNFLSVDTKPFDPETYEDEVEDDEVMDDEGRTRLKLKLENTLRWRVRQDEHGNDIKESNAKIVRWSDGTMSLYLGNEIFDVEKQKIVDFNHLFIRQGQGLQAQAVFAEKLIFRPHSTETLTHRKVTLNMADKTNRAQKVKVITDVGDNPEAQKQELIRLEEDKLRASARREAQQRRLRDIPRTTGLSSGFLEGYDSDEGGESIAAIKRRYQHGTFDGSQSYRASSESDDDAQGPAERAKSVVDAKISSDEESHYDEEVQQKHQQKQHKKKIIIDEDEE